MCFIVLRAVIEQASGIAAKAIPASQIRELRLIGFHGIIQMLGYGRARTNYLMDSFPKFILVAVWRTKYRWAGIVQASDHGALDSRMTVEEVRMVSYSVQIAVTKYQYFCFYKMKLLTVKRLSVMYFYIIKIRPFSWQNLWICLICGHIGCGRYVSRHAYKHFEETQHTYAMQLTNHRVWDYAGGEHHSHSLIWVHSIWKLLCQNLYFLTQLEAFLTAMANSSYTALFPMTGLNCTL